MTYSVDIENVIQEFEDTYGNEELYTRNFREKFIKWLSNFENDDEKKAFLELMKNYEYFNRKWFKCAFLSLYNKCLSQGITLEDSRILCMRKENEADSSMEYFGLIRELDRSNRLKFYSDTLLSDIKVIDGKEDVENVLFFDDISGTGGTVKKYLDKNKQYFKGKNIFVNICIITSAALKILKKYSEDEKSFNVKINYYELRNKSIDDNNIVDDNQKMDIVKIEKSLWGSGNQQVLGYKNSQLLITFFHNTPNNTISSFWFNDEFYNKNYKDSYGEKKWNELFGRYRPPKRNIQNMLMKKR